MFRTTKTAPKAVEPRVLKDGHLTGLERARLERFEEPHPVEPHASITRETPLEPLLLTEDQMETPVMPAAAPKPSNVVEDMMTPAPATESAAHLYVGPGIKLKGEISGCDTFRIEGNFDGNAKARQLVLCPGGNYLGTAEIEDAEIEGAFDGTLTVSGRLFLRSTGRISGTFSYGQLEIERGGEIAGQIAPHVKGGADAAHSPTQTTFKPHERPTLTAGPKPQASYQQSTRPYGGAAVPQQMRSGETQRASAPPLLRRSDEDMAQSSAPLDLDNVVQPG